MSSKYLDSPQQHGNDIIVAVLGSKERLACHHFVSQDSQGPQVSSWGRDHCSVGSSHCCSYHLQGHGMTCILLYRQGHQGGNYDIRQKTTGKTALYALCTLAVPSSSQLACTAQTKMKLFLWSSLKAVLVLLASWWAYKPCTLAEHKQLSQDIQGTFQGST